MKRAVTILAAAAAMALSATFTAGTASADTSSDPGTSPGESDRHWQRYRDYPNYLLCESTGATGVILGRWDDWWCDDDDVLWVKR